MTGCMREGCIVPATRQVCLRMWARGCPKSAANRADCETGLLVCEGHAEALEIDQIITDEGWARIVAGFRVIGKAEPDRDSVELFALAIVAEGHA